MQFGLIAGNGQFPFLTVEGARRAGARLAIVAIKEETDPKIEDSGFPVKWVGIGQLGKMISFFKEQRVEKAMMCGQVKHVQIFSGALPDMRMVKMLWNLPRRNTDSLIGGVADEMAKEDHQDADVEQVGAPHQLAPAQQLAGAGLPSVLLAIEAQQAAEQEYRQAQVGIPAKHDVIDGVAHGSLLKRGWRVCR